VIRGVQVRQVAYANQRLATQIASPALGEEDAEPRDRVVAEAIAPTPPA